MISRTRTTLIIALTVAAFALSPSSLFAQTVATPNSQYGWTQAQTATPAAALALTYKQYLDAGTTSTVLTGVTAIATPSVAQSSDCLAPIPPMTVGVHSVTISASNASLESAKSTSITFTMAIVPATPSNFRIVKLLGLHPIALVSQRSAFHWRRHALIGVIR